MYENLISIIALIFSALAIVFTVIGTGLSFTLGFRERAETSRRKTEIKNQLEQDLNASVHTFLEKSQEKNSSYEKITEDIMDLARMARNVDLADNLLENMTHYGNQFLRGSAFTLIYSIMLIIYATIYSGNVDILVFTMGIFLLAGTALLGYLAYSNLRKYYYLREDFLRLHEDPTMETCSLIKEDLETKKVRRIY